jgi:hypothetical protein
LVGLTFLYTAPKIPYRPFIYLRGLAFAKTLYLAAVWVAVTTILPLVISATEWQPTMYYYIANRFFLIFAVCILFDYKDRNEDKGIKNMVTYLTEIQLNILFYSIIVCFFLSSYFLFTNGFKNIDILILIVPAFILTATYPISKTNNNDYWYYIGLDGMVQASGGLYLIKQILIS